MRRLRTIACMKTVEIYTQFLCPYCSRALALLRDKGAPIDERDVTMDAEGRKAMVERAGGRTSVPQIFIGDLHIGGCDDLYALDAAGKLDMLLTA
jgi:glutaredoxin 3